MSARKSGDACGGGAADGDACGGPRLAGCDIHRCEGRCCYDGVYLMQGEEPFLRELVGRVPRLAEHLPQEFIVDGWWEGAMLGRKTATRPQQYHAPDFPAHFTRTRCVFSDAAGFCELEKLARSRGQHPWIFKPAMCWMFPLQGEEDDPQPPPMTAEEDPYRTEQYPGYSAFVPCGMHQPQGRPWREALAGEIDYLARAERIPLLGTPGHTVAELLGADARDEAQSDTPADQPLRAG